MPEFEELLRILCPKNRGLTTREALVRLHNDILVEVTDAKREFAKRGILSWLRESISFKSELSKMRWPSVLFMIAQAIAHFVVAFVLDIDHVATGWIGFQGFILTTLLFFNLAVNLWDTQLRFKELLMKSEQILDLILRCSRDEYLLKQWKRYNWSSARAKTLFIPKSPCVHQTLTYRDESCLNLPDYLLVKGDIIHLYPGERAPGDCVTLTPRVQSPTSGPCGIVLKAGQIFHSRKCADNPPESVQKSNGHGPDECSKLHDKRDMMIQFNHAKLKQVNLGSDFLMLSTPYIKSLRISLQRSHKRPVNSVEKECFIISRKYFETFVIPSVFIMSTIVTAVHYGYLDLTGSDQKIKTISIAYLLLRPSLTIMPFLPWMFPCLWLAVNAYGSARILCCANGQRAKLGTDLQGTDVESNSPYWSTRISNNTALSGPMKFENLLATPTAAGSSENKHDDDDLHDLQSNIKFGDIVKVFKDLVMGKGGHVWRSSSLLQVLGCLTSLCCIDKVGILSWSNPTPEKVFCLTQNQDEESRFLESMQNHPDHKTATNQPEDEHNRHRIVSVNPDSHDNEISSMAKIYHDEQYSTQGNHATFHVKPLHSNQSRVEVLDVSQASSCFRGYRSESIGLQQQARLQFDDLGWRRYVGNLKPLGLAILMNNCCEKSFGDYFRFYKHISYESILRCNLTPVVKRRCICGLAKLIGFSKDAVKSYKYINQIGIYKLIDPSSIKKGKLVSSLENTTRLKLPFPNMTCNIHQDVATGSYQVFSQGTADIVLDACVEYWDGKQLLPLDESSRKKIMDFYHRTSLTSYCSAFSYTPLLKLHRLDGYYIELPPENSKFVPHLRQLINEHLEEYLENQLINLPSQTVETYESQQSIKESFTPLIPTHMNSSSTQSRIKRRHLSFERLRDFVSDKSPKRKPSDRKASKKGGLSDALDELTDQVFVGMVALQYQACPDFVALVEQLEHACIRFVHFSKENELRSRVFSEKMGLESGWNCHISLQSDKDLAEADKSDSRSAPSPSIMEHDDTLSSFCPNSRISNILFGCSVNKYFERLNEESSDDLTANFNRSFSSNLHTPYSWRSLPSLVMQLSAKISAARHHINTPEHGPKNNRIAGQHNHLSDHTNDSLAPESDFGDETGPDGDRELTDGSAKDEKFESLAFDMSNRAKLPKGIENIRPHLETVDNIPLQVSLFTDCTPELTQEMIEIMQDYGEIVCVIGSSSSKLNTPVFLQANASIAIEPLVPQSCTRNDDRVQRSLDRKREKRLLRDGRNDRKVTKILDEDDLELGTVQSNSRPNNPRDRLGIGPVESSKPIRTRPQQRTSSSSSSQTSSSSHSSSSADEFVTEFNDDFADEERLVSGRRDVSDASEKLLRDLPGPSSLASKLASLPCSYSYNRKDQVNLYSLIMEARHFTFKMKNTFVCMICFALSISSAQFLATILFLPPMLSSGLTIWLTVVVVPLMSFSLMSTTMDSQVMKIAVGKNLQLKPENITFFVICYLIKFIPSIVVVVLSYGLIIAHSCKLTGFGSSSLGPCWMFTYVQHGNTTSQDTGDEDLLWSTHLLTAQVCAAFLLVLYFVVISAGFVHSSHLMWQRSPTRNHCWVAISLLLIFGQLFYNQLLLQVNLGSSELPHKFLASLPLHVWLISFLWPILLIGINLLVKQAEIKATIRQQRRARFDFNTKLGMNSPF